MLSSRTILQPLSFKTIAISLCIASVSAYGQVAPYPLDQNTLINGDLSIGDAPGAPLTIAISGNFVLAGNLQNTTNTVDAVQVSGSRVALDLNGFAISSNNSCSTTSTSTVCTLTTTTSNAAGAGIRVTGSNVSIRNGSVSNHRSVGVTCVRCDLSSLVADQNGFDGLTLGSGRLSRIGASTNFNNGITLQTSSGSSITDSSAEGNGRNGFEVDTAVIRDSRAVSNARHGILSSYGSVLEGNIARSNGRSGTGVGINAFGTLVRNNATAFNSVGGFAGQDGSFFSNSSHQDFRPFNLSGAVSGQNVISLAGRSPIWATQAQSSYCDGVIC